METATRVKRYAAYLVGVVGFSGVLYGLGGAAAMAVALPYVKATCPSFTSGELSRLVAACMFGAVASSFLAGPLSDWIGRKKTLLLAALVFACGGPVLCFSGGRYWTMLAGQLTFGAGMGVLGVVSPMYLAECLDAESRGKGTAFFQLLLIAGIMVSGVTGLVIANAIGAADDATLDVAKKFLAWKTVFLAESAPALLLLLGLLPLKESPRWLYRRGRRDEALAALAANNGEEKARRVLDEMVAADAAEAARKQALAATPKDSLLQKKYVAPFLIAFVILVCNQTTGVNGVLGYSVMIFQQSGLVGKFANCADTVFKFVMLAMTALACVLVDRKGRKFLLEAGTLGIIAGSLGTGAVFLGIQWGWFQPSLATGWAVAGFLTLFIAAFAVGPGVCVWLALTELMPNRIRAVGMSVALLANQGVAFGLQATMLPLRDAVGYGWLFVIFAACTVVYFATAAFFMPETKGKTLEEIEAFFK